MNVGTIRNSMIKRAASLIFYEGENGGIPAQPNYTYRVIPNGEPTPEHIRLMMKYLREGNMFVPKGWTLEGEPTE